MKQVSRFANNAVPHTTRLQVETAKKFEPLTNTPEVLTS